MTTGYAPHQYPQARETVGPNRAHAPFDSQPLETKLDYVIGLLTRHDEGFFKNDVQRAAAGSGLAAGAKVFDNVAFSGDLQARTLIVDNPGGYVLQVDGLGRQIPAGVYGYVVPCRPALRQLTLSIVSGSSAAAVNVTVFATENVFSPIPIAPAAGPGATQAVTSTDGALATVGTTTDASSASTLVGLLKNVKAALAGTLTVAITAGANLIGSVKVIDTGGTNALGVNAANEAKVNSADGSLVTIGTTTDASSAVTLVGLLKNIKAALAGTLTIAFAAAQSVNATIVGPVTATNSYANVAEKGANNYTMNVQTSTASSVQIAAARATRKRLRLRNLDAANSFWYNQGAAATTATAILKFGESADIFGLGAVNIIDNGAHASVQCEDWYD